MMEGRGSGSGGIKTFFFLRHFQETLVYQCNTRHDGFVHSVERQEMNIHSLRAFLQCPSGCFFPLFLFLCLLLFSLTPRPPLHPPVVRARRSPLFIHFARALNVELLRVFILIHWGG